MKKTSIISHRGTTSPGEKHTVSVVKNDREKIPMEFDLDSP